MLILLLTQCQVLVDQIPVQNDIHGNLAFNLELLLYENLITVVLCLLLGKRNHSSKDTLLYSAVYSL